MTIYPDIEKAPDRKPGAFFQQPNNLQNKLSDIGFSVALKSKEINRIFNKEFLRLLSNESEYDISCSRSHNKGDRFQSDRTLISDARNHSVVANTLCLQSLSQS